MTITYYKNQIDLLDATIRIIDDYWEKKIPEKDMIENLVKIINNNGEIIFNDGLFRGTIRQRLGKKRITLIEKVLNDCFNIYLM